MTADIASPTEELAVQFSQAKMSDSIETTAPVQSTHFRLLDLPTEVFQKIIKETLAIERSVRRPDYTSPDPLDTTFLRLCDFNISAYGLRCHSLPPFGLLFVNKFVSREALAVVYQNSTFAIFAEIPRRGDSDNAFGHIPNLVRHITPTMKANAREVTYHISTIAEGSRRQLLGTPFEETLHRALDELQVLVDDATFSNVKFRSVVLKTNGLCQKHLDVIFKLFAQNNCLVALEELCHANNDMGEYRQELDEYAFGEMVKRSAVAAGQPWMLFRKPKLELKSGEGSIWRTVRVEWARLRTWNQFIAPTRQT